MRADNPSGLVSAVPGLSYQVVCDSIQMADGAICFIPPIQNSRNKAYSAFAHLSNMFPFCWGPTPYICSFIAQLVIVNKLAHVTAHFLFPIWYDLISFLPLSEHVFVEGPWRGELQRAHASILGISSVPSFPASHLSHVLYGYMYIHNLWRRHFSLA